MGKHEVGTPKYIANKIKAKGLQKLRWYCQMCEKQCRDENGFKCHTMSESHHRQLLLFADNASRYMDQFSKEFSQGYLNILKRQFGTKRVPANRVYQNYIADRGHIHMNATIWLSLTAFVKYLGRTGQCIVDETEKGWFVTYIDRDPETIAAQERKAKKEKMDKDDQERMMEFIEKQVEKGQMEKSDDSNTFKEPEPFVRPEEDAPLVLPIKLKPTAAALNASMLKYQLNIKKENKEDEKKDQCLYLEDTERPIKKLKKSEDSVEDTHKSKGGWLVKDLIVKVTTKTLGDKYYKAKGVIQTVENSGFVAKVKLKTPDKVKDHVIKLDQEYLETVIPAIGKEVLILWGKHKGAKGIVKKIHIEEYSVEIELKRGEKVVKFPYEQVCKYVG